jgi:hypothetical protein
MQVSALYTLHSRRKRKKERKNITVIPKNLTNIQEM